MITDKNKNNNNWKLVILLFYLGFFTQPLFSLSCNSPPLEKWEKDPGNGCGGNLPTLLWMLVLTLRFEGLTMYVYNTDFY